MRCICLGHMQLTRLRPDGFLIQNLQRAACCAVYVLLFGDQMRNRCEDPTSCIDCKREAEGLVSLESPTISSALTRLQLRPVHCLHHTDKCSLHLRLFLRRDLKSSSTSCSTWRKTPSDRARSHRSDAGIDLQNLCGCSCFGQGLKCHSPQDFDHQVCRRFQEEDKLTLQLDSLPALLCSGLGWSSSTRRLPCSCSLHGLVRC